MDLKTVFFLLAIFCGAALSKSTGNSKYVEGLETYRDSASIGNYSLLWERNDGKAWTLNVKGQRLAILPDVSDTKFKVYKYQETGDKECVRKVFYIFEVSQSVYKSEVGKLVTVSDNQIVLMKKPDANWNGEATKIRSEFVFRRGFRLRHSLNLEENEGNKISGFETYTENDNGERQQWIVEPNEKLTLSKPTTKFNFDAFFKLVKVQ